MIRQLRPHQERGIAMLRESLRSGKRRPVLQAPCGAGKTLLSAAVIEMALNKGNRVIFTVPRITLVDQTVDAFMAEGIHDVGVIQQAHELTDSRKPVQVCSVDSLARRDIPPAGLVIVDEAHLQREFVLEWMKRPEWLKVPFVGLSATPWAKGMAMHWDDLIVVATTKELIEKGLLSPYRAFAPSEPDMAGVKTVAGDYHQGQSSEVMSKPRIVGDVVQNWLEHGENRQTLCFAVDRSHAKHLRERFQAAGVATGYVDCFSKPDERAQLEADFRSGAVRVACSVGVLTTGVDWSVGCVILARPTKSEMFLVQACGRGLRTDDEFRKHGDCKIFDHTGSLLRLGTPSQIHHEHLDDGRERAKAEASAVALPKKCPQCAYLKPPKVSVCPACGFEAKHGPKAQRVEEGELVELKPRAPKTLITREQLIAQQADFFAELQGYAKERGYKPGWAAMKFKDREGIFPNDPRVRNVAARQPSQATRNWCKSQQIRWAKSKRRAEEARP